MEEALAAVQALREASFEPATAATIVQHISEDVDWVLLGEATHGTHEFYELRAEITKVLIEERGFNAIATEADFPDAFRVNQWVCQLNNEDSSPREALGAFKRFPTWMWRNEEVATFLQWLHARNDAIEEEEKRHRMVGFYGMDIYSLASSTHSVIEYLQKIDSQAAEAARKRYSCFDRYGSDAVSYAFGLAKGHTSCETDAITQLVETLKEVGKRRDQVSGKLSEEEAEFAAVSNARVVKEAEQYYRSMFFAENLTWNIRDKHMTETACHLRTHLLRKGIKRPKIVVWAHNTHVGDARNTDMGRTRGEFTVGQLLREKFGNSAVSLVGMTTYKGQVLATDDWGGACKPMELRTCRNGSHEALLHCVGPARYGVDLRSAPAAGALTEALRQPRLQRSVGVLYQGASEQEELESHYFMGWMRHQWDLLVHIDETTASRPLDADGGGEDGDGVGDGDGGRRAEDGRDSFTEDDDPSGAPPTFPSGV